MKCSMWCRMRCSAPLRIGSLRPVFAASFGVPPTAPWLHRPLHPGLHQGTGDLCPQHRHLVLVLHTTPTLTRICCELLPSLILRRPTWLALPLWASLQGRLLVRPLMGTMRMLRVGTWATDPHDWHWWCLLLPSDMRGGEMQLGFSRTMWWAWALPGWS